MNTRVVFVFSKSSGRSVWPVSNEIMRLLSEKSPAEVSLSKQPVYCLPGGFIFRMFKVHLSAGHRFCGEKKRRKKYVLVGSAADCGDCLCGNLCWGNCAEIGYFLCIGLPVAIALGVLGLLLCVTIIGIPLGILLFKLAGGVLFLF